MLPVKPPSRPGIL